MTVTRAQFLSLLEPILKDIKSDSDYPRRETIYTKLFSVSSTKKAKETFFEYAGLGDFQVKSEGGPVSFTDPIAGAEMTLVPVRRSNGYKITQEMLDHDQFGEIRKLETELRIALRDDLEVIGHLLLNNGFGTTDSGGFTAAGFDTVALFSTAHTRIDGGANQSNRPSTDADLDWTTLGDARQQFQLWRDNRGRRVLGRPRNLWVHVNDELTAMELLRSVGKPGTANNEVNVLNQEFNLIVSPYITDTDSWFVQGDSTDAIWLWDVNPRASSKDDWDNEVIQRKMVHGESLGHLRWFNWYGTTGAG